MEEQVDLFEQWETLPIEVQAILNRYCDGDNSYEKCAMLVSELETVGYTCDYGLSGEPYDLRKMTAKDKLYNLFEEVKKEMEKVLNKITKNLEN